MIIKYILWYLFKRYCLEDIINYMYKNYRHIGQDFIIMCYNKYAKEYHKENYKKEEEIEQKQPITKILIENDLIKL